MEPVPQTIVVTAPPLFGGFYEARTRGQRRRHWMARAKFAVKWLLNWKGARKR